MFPLYSLNKPVFSRSHRGWGWVPPCARPRGPLPPLPPSKKIKNKKRERKTVFVRIPAAQLIWPSVKKMKAGTVLVPDLARKVSRRHWLVQPMRPAAPTGPIGPAERKFYCINAITVHVFFYFSWRPACALSDAQKQPRLEGKIVYVFFYFSRRPLAL